MSEAAERISHRSVLSEEVAHFRQNHNVTETVAARFEEQAAALYDQRIMDERIATFNDNNPEIRKQVEAAAEYLTDNPRDLKRFINCFRFFFFLWWWRKSRGQEVPTLDQLMRWLVLCLRWPEVVRWLRRSEGIDWLITSGSTMPSLVNQLETLEELGTNCVDLPAWQAQAHSVLRLTSDKAAWLEDDDLLQFFSRETRFSENDRLSNSPGKGLW